MTQIEDIEDALTSNLVRLTNALNEGRVLQSTTYNDVATYRLHKGQLQYMYSIEDGTWRPVFIGKVNKEVIEQWLDRNQDFLRLCPRQ